MRRKEPGHNPNLASDKDKDKGKGKGSGLWPDPDFATESKRQAEVRCVAAIEVDQRVHSRLRPAEP